MDEATIKCVGIKKSYGTDQNKVEALKGIDLEVFDNELTLLVGPSGSGKTTLLSIITTILNPDAGQLYLMGHETSQMSDVEKAKFCSLHLGVVFQSLFLIPTLTVAENVSLPLLVLGYKEKDAIEQAMIILEKLHIQSWANRSPTMLSKGQQQRVAVARAMVNNANIIICDEPTSALDQATGHEVVEFMHELATKAKKTVLVVTHDHRIFSSANRILYLNDGKIVPEEV